MISITLVEILAKRAIQQANNNLFSFLTFTEDEKQTISYEQLHQKAYSIARKLLSIIKPGDRALLLYAPGLDFIEAFYGCLLAGIIAVPAYPPRKNHNMDRLQSIILDCDAKLVLTGNTTHKIVQNNIKQVQALKNISIVITSNIDSLSTYDLIIKPKEDDIAFLQYTSGSTGNPKGVMVTHSNLFNNSKIIKEAFKLNENSFLVSWLPMFHDMGLIGSVVQPLFAGFPAVLMSPTSFLQKPSRWIKTISDYKADISGGPNFAYEHCANFIKDEEISDIDLSNWKLAYSGAEPVRHSTFQKFIKKFEKYGFCNKAPYPCFGMAETTLILTGGNRNEKYNHISLDRDFVKTNIITEANNNTINKADYVSCGKVYGDHQIKIVNPETKIECKENQVGEIWAAGSSITKGYWKKNDLNSEVYQVNLNNSSLKYFRTGDLGFIYQNELFVTGRLKDLIIIRGRNFYPQDIEKIVEDSHEMIQGNSVASFAIEKSEIEELVVMLELKRTAIRNFNHEELIKCITESIIKVFELQVSHIIFLKPMQIPKTSSGKIQRSHCRTKFLENTIPYLLKYNSATSQILKETTPEANQIPKSKTTTSIKSPIINTITTKIARILSKKQADIDTNAPFSTMGIDSLMAIQISGEIQEELNIKLSDTIVYDYPTINSLAKHISSIITKTQEYSNKKKKQYKNEPIAIVGMSCRFPKANNINSFWDFIINSKEGIDKAPPERGKFNMPYLRDGGYLNDIDKFDAEFFGISPKEAKIIDPQQRILLEECYQALITSGHNPSELTGSNTGVFIGLSQNDYSRICASSKDRLSPYLATGNASSISANRISYIFDFKGPSLTIDTACSSSLVAIHQSLRSLQLGECDLAIAGGINLNLSSQITNSLENANMLASDNHCKVFDASADGYSRGEGCGIIILKKLSDAQKSQDKIHAIIKGSATIQDGRSNGLSAPNGLSQQKVLRQALENANLSPSDIHFIETHGTGTKLGDPIEVHAISEVYKNRTPDSKLYLSAIKANIGHLESAAGIAGLIKAVLCLQNRMLPKQLHFTTRNPHINWEKIQLEVPTDFIKLQSNSDQPLRAGVSSFGFGGMNAHIILEENIVNKTKECKNNTPFILTLSAKNETALKQLTKKYLAYLKQVDPLMIPNICYTANCCNENYKNKYSVVGLNKADLIKSFENKNLNPNNKNIQYRSNLTFVFTGQGSQYINMGKCLYNSQPVFKAAVDHCENILTKELNVSIKDVIFSDILKNNTLLLDQTNYTQPALLTIEYGLLKLWQHWGITPDIVIGHSVGEYSAAVAAGVLNINDALMLIAKRGQLMQQLPKNGGMASINCSVETAIHFLAPYKQQLSIASINGSCNTVITGEQTVLKKVCTQLEENGFKVHFLKVSHAFHSPLMNPIIKEFIEYAQTFKFNSPKIPIISNLTGNVAKDEITTPKYWADHILQPVQFYRSLNTIAKKGETVLLEIGPKTTLISLSQQAELENLKGFFASIRPNIDDQKQMFLTAAELYKIGYKIDWQGFYNKRLFEKTILPKYPFQGKSFWVETDNIKITPDINHDLFYYLKTGQFDAITNLLKDSEQLSEQHFKYLPDILQSLSNTLQENKEISNINKLYYTTNWHKKTLSIEKNIANENYLIFADEKGLGEKLASRLKASGNECSLVYASNRYNQLNHWHYAIAPTEIDDYKKIIQTINNKSKQPISRILHLWSLDVLPNKDISTETLKITQIKGIGTLVNLAKAMLSLDTVAKVKIITKFSQAVLENEKTTLLSSLIWGFGRVLSLELPQYWDGLIDLDNNDLKNENSLIFDLIQVKHSEDHIAIRHNECYVPRLNEEKLSNNKKLQINKNESYIITGGTGWLGLHATEWLGKRGANNIYLISRKQPSSDKVKKIEILKKKFKTSNIINIQADVCDFKNLSALFKQLKLEKSPIKGIIHAAGISDNKTINNLTYKDIEQTTSAKTIGSWNLHNLSKEMDLSFFVTYSSISSVWGSASQAPYAAANHFLDALSAYRKAIGLKSTNINWGPWSGGGMTSSKNLEKLSIRGIKPVTPEMGEQALDQINNFTGNQNIIANINWQTFMPLYELSGKRSILALFASNNTEEYIEDKTKNTAKSETLTNIENSLSEERKPLLVSYLKKEVASLLEFESTYSIDSEKGFSEMGIDSLMAVELKNTLDANFAIKLPLTIVFEYPNINLLADYILNELFNCDNAKNKIIFEENDTEINEKNIHQFSENELEKLIDKELKELIQ